MTDRCPYCLQTVTKTLPQILKSLTPRESHIYETVLNTGLEGIATEALAEECIPGRNAITLRTAVHNVNAKIAPLKIKTQGGRCYLDRTNWPEDRTQGEQDEVCRGSAG